MTRRAVRALAVLVFAWAAYRSAAVGITVSEAVTYNHYASQPLLQILTAPYHPGNQILHTLSCWLVLRVFRLTEWSFRLPGLIGLMLYFWAAGKLCRSVCGTQVRSAIATLLCVLNPFTIGWLPVSSGVWTAAALFLLAARNCYDFLKRGDADKATLGKTSVLLGLAAGFDISFLIPAVALLLTFLHLNFWGMRKLRFWDTINLLLLPAFVTVFALWGIPLLNRQGAVRFELSLVVLLPALLALSLPKLVDSTSTWKLAGGTAVLGALAIFVLLRLDIAYLRDRFHQGPERTANKAARALRDDIRRSVGVRPIQVKASQVLIEPLNFYRKRYALGAVQPILPVAATGAATGTATGAAMGAAMGAAKDIDYFMLLPKDFPAADSLIGRKIFTSGEISLFARHPADP